MTVELPSRLAAAAPGWRAEADVVVVGSGVAGLTAALRAPPDRHRPARHQGRPRRRLDAKWAQGGIAAAMGRGDTPEQHLHDTLVAGAGLCDEEAVRVLVTEGPGPVGRLIDEGATSTSTRTARCPLTREGGHHRDRIAHAGGDATGAEISRALVAAAKADPGVEIIEHALVLDLLTAADGPVCGVDPARHGRGPARRRRRGGRARGRGPRHRRHGPGVLSRPRTRAVSTGDGVAVALRAGAEVADLEFVQFHPTVLYLGAQARGPAAADLRGGARRGRPPRRRRRHALHGRAARAGRAGAARHRRQGDHAPDARDRRVARVARRPAPRRRACGRTGSRRSSVAAAAYGIDPVTELDPGRARRATTPAAACAPTWTAAPPSRACTRAARSPAPGCTAPTGSPPTPSSRAWSSPSGSPPTWPARPAAAPGAARPRRRRRRRRRCWRRRRTAAGPATMTEGAGVLRSADSLARHAAERLRPSSRDRSSSDDPPHRDLGGDQPPTVARVLVAAARLREETRGSPLARGLPRPRRRALARPPRRTAGRRPSRPRASHRVDGDATVRGGAMSQEPSTLPRDLVERARPPRALDADAVEAPRCSRALEPRTSPAASTSTIRSATVPARPAGRRATSSRARPGVVAGLGSPRRPRGLHRRFEVDRAQRRGRRPGRGRARCC